MSEVITIQDLETLKKHEIFEAEVLTGKVGGLATGADIDYATNAATGQVQKTLPAILRDIGFRPASFTFETGGTLAVGDSDVGVLWPITSGGDGQYYLWKGTYPKVVPAASSPASTGGVSDSAWLPLGDLTLREDLAASDGATLVGVIQAGAGAVPRTSQDKMRDIKHVNDFGGDLKVAIQAVPEYTTIVLDAKEYDITGLYSHDFNFGAGPFVSNTKKGLRLQGAGMPRVSSNGHKLEGGTVIQGSLVNTAHDFEVFDLGVDTGHDVCTAKYGGEYAEGFCPGINTSFPTRQPTIRGVAFDRVISLGRDPVDGDAATYKHTTLCENLEDVSIGKVESVGGFHCFVSKMVNATVDTIVARGGGLGNAVIFKSDEANPCRENTVSQLLIDTWDFDGVEKLAGPLTYQSSDPDFGTRKIKIGTVRIRKPSAITDAVQFAGGIIPLTDCSIGHLEVDAGEASASIAAFRCGYTSAVDRFVIGTHNIIAKGRTFEIGTNAKQVHIGSGSQVIIGNLVQPIMSLNGVYTHGEINIRVETAQTAPFAIQRTSGDVQPGLITFSGGTPPNQLTMFSPFPGTLTLNATNFASSGLAGFAVPGAQYIPYRVQLKGVAKVTVGGGALRIGTVAPKPARNMRFVVAFESGGVASARVIEILPTTGEIVLFGTVATGDYVHLDSVSYDALV